MNVIGQFKTLLWLSNEYSKTTWSEENWSL